jgi:hypothetical protein
MTSTGQFAWSALSVEQQRKRLNAVIAAKLVRREVRQVERPPATQMRGGDDRVRGVREATGAAVGS